jgi:hypothetical protein
LSSSFDYFNQLCGARAKNQSVHQLVLENLFKTMCFVFNAILALSLSVSCETQLRSGQFSRHVWAKFALTHFVKRRAQWQEVQTGESKKRKLFSDILE